MALSLSSELSQLIASLSNADLTTWILILLPIIPLGLLMGYIALVLLAPIPRPSTPSEKQYLAVQPDGTISSPRTLPDWTPAYAEERKRDTQEKRSRKNSNASHTIDPASVLISVVVPAYNEQERIGVMLEETLAFLRSEYSGKHATSAPGVSGWEIVVVSDGSTDRTVEVVLDFARREGLFDTSRDEQGAMSTARSMTIKSNGSASRTAAPSQQEGTLRVIKLAQNRGKGGAVVHGMRHVRGQYVIFADADGASRFSDIKNLIAGVERVKDGRGRAVGIGSRAHLVGSEQVVKRSFLRNALMHSFHVLLRLMTSPATAAIGDTQCGFKLFTRAALPSIIPHMHSEGWIFDVEMLMLAESAGVPMVEVAIGWQEVGGSKLNVVWDSLGMAYGLALLRAAWLVGVYRRE